MEKLLRVTCYAKEKRLWIWMVLLLLRGPLLSMAQDSNMTISYEASEVKAGVVLKEIEKQTEATLTYNQDEFNTVVIKKISWRHISLRQALQELQHNYGILYSIAGNNIALKLLPAKTPAKAPVNGKITGRVLDEETGEPMSGATIKAGNSYAVSEVDGSFAITLLRGKYTLVITSVGYGTKNITDVEIKGNQLLELNLTLKKERGTLTDVVVTADVKKETVSALYARQKNNAAMSDGISAEQISRTPDKNVGESLKRISGLSTLDNKFTVVRGLSERYNGAVLNGQLMPSTELNRRNFSFDIIPSSMVENITVIKTLTPDRSAEFGGGLVEVNTIEVPSRNFLTLSAGGSLNDKTSGKPFLSLALEGREYTGSVSKHRYLFGTLDWKTGNDAARYYSAHGSNATLFANNWGITSMKAQPSQNYQVSLGRVMKAPGGGQWGVTASMGYRNTQNRVDVRTGREGWISSSADNTAGNSLLGARAERYDFSTNLAGMLGIGYRGGNHRISFQSLYLRTLNQQLTVIYDGNGPDGKGNWGMSDITTQTTLWQNQLKGEHLLNKKGLRLNWLGNYTYLDKQRPDNHILLANAGANALAPDSNNINITDPTSLYGYNRWWSRAVEKNFSWDASVSMPYTLAGSKQLFKAGYAGWSKDRLFFVLNTVSSSGAGLDGFAVPLTSAFGPGYLGSINILNSGDSMHKSAVLHAFYGMMDNRLGAKWRLVWGVRGEYLNMGNLNGYLDHQESSQGLDLSDWRKREKNWQFFPSANLTYSLTRQMNFRLAYARSIIRPDLRELAYFHEYDYELGGEYGGAAVRSTLIDHYDFRYEWYPAAGDIISVTGFYKLLHYPMEIFQEPNHLFELKNSKEAKNYGMEMEVRKSLAFTGVPVIRNLTLYGNLTYLDARVRPMLIKAVADPSNPAKTSPVEEIYGWEKRPQAGASNYIYNAGAYFDSRIFFASMVYNVVTNRLVRVIEGTSTQQSSAYLSYYEQPAKSLDAQLAVRLMDQRLQVRLNVANLLNSFSIVYYNNETPDANGNITKKQAGYQKGIDAVDYRAASGRTYSMTVTYSFR